jgi:hypothetical protein
VPIPAYSLSVCVGLMVLPGGIGWRDRRICFSGGFKDGPGIDSRTLEAVTNGRHSVLLFVWNWTGRGQFPAGYTETGTGQFCSPEM